MGDYGPKGLWAYGCLARPLDCSSLLRLTTYIYPGPGASGFGASDVEKVQRGASTIIIWGKGTSSVFLVSTETLEALHPPIRPRMAVCPNSPFDELDATLSHRWIRPMHLANGLGVSRSRRLTRGVEERWAWNDLRLSHTHDRWPSRNEQCYSMARIWPVALPFFPKPLPRKHLVNLTIKLL